MKEIFPISEEEKQYVTHLKDEGKFNRTFVESEIKRLRRKEYFNLLFFWNRKKIRRELSLNENILLRNSYKKELGK
jgi:hypothetical protein